MRYIFFSLRDFKVDVGESVRMYGLLNSLAEMGHDVVFISNATRYGSFHRDIEHIQLGYSFWDKRRLQGLLALLPATAVYHRYRALFDKISVALKSANVSNEPVYFFDYLDNSIGYVLKRSGLIKAYVNDVHGITTIEFLNHANVASSSRSRVLYKIKYYLADRLDKKVFSDADGLIYGSNHMKKYFEERYQLHGQRTAVIPYVLGRDAVNRKVDAALKQRLLGKLTIQPNEFVVFFVGSYKPTAGVDDLINAFERLYQDDANVKLVLIGDGPYREKCFKLASGLKSVNKIIFIEHIPYEQLATYQSLANVIVCPDKQNLFSQYVVHVKYFDALISGKLVINGAFESVQEINKNDFLSISFDPSDVNDLYQKLKMCKVDWSALIEKYKNVKEYAAWHLTYSSYLNQLSQQFAGVAEEGL
jgi:glycosyltransferase involved in cell wall biosynthesis